MSVLPKSQLLRSPVAALSALFAKIAAACCPCALACAEKRRAEMKPGRRSLPQNEAVICPPPFVPSNVSQTEGVPRGGNLWFISGGIEVDCTTGGWDVEFPFWS